MAQSGSARALGARGRGFKSHPPDHSDQRGVVLTGPDSLRERAREVLRRNDAGRWTRPSPRQYPHQWNWDSAFAAIGWSTFDWPRACLEIESLLEAQWIDGMIPHLRYDPAHLADYFPGPDWWPAAQGRTRRPGIPTSGITNPPVLPLAALKVGRRQPDAGLRHAFWRRVLAPLVDWLSWFLDRRRPAGAALPVLFHPWETGWDNSPRWDLLAGAGLHPLRRFQRLDQRHVDASERPSDRDYDTYLSLADSIDGARYDAAEILAVSPFAVHDVLVDAIWHAAALAADAMAEALGQPPPFAPDVLTGYRSAFLGLHHDPEGALLLDFDVKNGRPIRVDTAAGAAALAGGILEQGLATEVWGRYRAHCRGARLVPTTSPEAPQFDAARYWRGPVWVSVNWLVLQGLTAAGLAEAAAALREETLDLVERGGFHEYFDARSGEGRGIEDFTWSAALTLDLLDR